MFADPETEALEKSGLDKVEIDELVTLFELHALKRSDFVITESEAKHLWNLLGVWQAPPVPVGKELHLISQNIFLIRTGEYMQLGQAHAADEEQIIYQMLDPMDDGSVTRDKLSGFLKTTGLDVNDDEVDILTERINFAGGREDFSKKDFLTHMVNSRGSRAAFAQSLTLEGGDGIQSEGGL